MMPPAAFAVHQLRYWLAFHGMSGIELQRQGHAYLHSLVPWIVALIAIAVGAFLRALGRALGGACSRPRYTLSFGLLWLICSVCLLSIYMSQEFLEGLYVTGHPAGLTGIFGYGGWWAVPAAVGVGLVLAASFHGARWVLRETARRSGALRAACCCPRWRRSRPAGPVADRLADQRRCAPLLSAASVRVTACRWLGQAHCLRRCVLTLAFACGLI
jgi:hypothetical protein